MRKQVIKWLSKGRIAYDVIGTYIWMHTENEGSQMIGEVRGWGAIKNMFKSERGAEDFQDELGKFIAEAVQEKIERDS